MSGYRVSAFSQTPISFMPNAVTTTSGTNLTYYNYQNIQTGDSIQIVGDDVVGYNIEDAFGKDEEFHEHLVRIRCPHCAYPNYPFRKRERPKCLETGEEWVGMDYKQPYAHYSTECSYCHEVFYMRLFAPQ